MTGPLPDDPVVALSERTRRSAAILFVFLALIHLLYPTVAIDGVFIGLLALAGIVLLFDIQSVEALGVRARARDVRTATKEVEEAKIPESGTAPEVPKRAGRSAIAPAPETVHREPTDLMPPTERVARILWAVEQIRIELIVLAATAGYLTRRARWSDYRLHELAPLLEQRGVVPDAFARSLVPLSETRNALAHGRPVRSGLLASVDELALTLVARVRELPRTYARVVIPEVDLFRDQSLTALHGVKGVLIEQRDQNGTVLTQKVFPTEQPYEKGRFVSWEWDMSKGIEEEAWFRDPSAGSPRLAFSSAAMFAGREFPEQWGLEFRAGPLLDE